MTVTALLVAPKRAPHRDGPEQKAMWPDSRVPILPHADTKERVVIGSSVFNTRRGTSHSGVCKQTWVTNCGRHARRMEKGRAAQGVGCRARRRGGRRADGENRIQFLDSNSYWAERERSERGGGWVKIGPACVRVEARLERGGAGSCACPPPTNPRPNSHARGSEELGQTQVAPSQPQEASVPSLSGLQSSPTANSVWWSQTRRRASSGAAKSQRRTVMS